MMKVLTPVALLLALGAGAVQAPVHAQQKQDQRQDQRYWNENDMGLWDSDNWVSDNYGYYDEDFGWNTDDRAWNDWYGDADQVWNAYDYVGEEGWFDV